MYQIDSCASFGPVRVHPSESWVPDEPMKQKKKKECHGRGSGLVGGVRRRYISRGPGKRGLSLVDRPICGREKWLQLPLPATSR